MTKSNYQHFADLMRSDHLLGSGIFADKKINENEAKYQLVFKHAPIGLMYFDQHGVITSCNDAFAEMMGSSNDAIHGLDIVGLPDKRIVGLVNNVLKGELSTTEVSYTSVTGKKSIYAKINLQPIIDNDGQVIGGVGIIEDITQRSEYERRLQYLSQRDPVTELFNRAYFEQQLELINNSLFKEQIAVIICDIDNLKLINDTMGHLAGDRLLKAAAGIIQKSSARDSIAARIGGDEFAVLVPTASTEYIEMFKKELQENITLHNLANPDIPVSISSGCAISQQNQTDLKVLMREADLCMYRQKINHRQKNRQHIVQNFLKTLQSADESAAERSRRLKAYLTVFGRALNLSEVTLDHLLSLADYHDIGRVSIEKNPVFAAVRDSKLTDLETRKHCEIGCRIALASDDTAILANTILKHHEFWNGMGYPLGIKGEEIPLECRIFAIADAYDEMINRQPDGPDREEVIKALQDMAGCQLDPRLTGIFIQLLKEQNMA